MIGEDQERLETRASVLGVILGLLSGLTVGAVLGVGLHLLALHFR